MSNTEHFLPDTYRRGRQRGQAYAEYLLITAVLVGALLLIESDIVSPVDGRAISPLAALVSNFKSLFGAYSFTLSLP